MTGATGFIGNHVISALLSRGDVEVIATATSAEKAETKDWFSQVQFVVHTISGTGNQEGLFEKFHQPDALIHLAWQGLPNYKQLFHFEEVLPAQYAFIKSLVSQGLKDVTVTGTCFEYGMQEGCLSEAMSAMPANPYALAKDTLRRFLEALKVVMPFSLKWTRLFYMYGEGQSETAILPQLARAIERGDAIFNMSGGEQQRDYLPVEDVAKNIISIALQNEVVGIINCASNRPMKIRQLVENYLSATHANIELNLGYYPYPDYESFAFWGDNHKLNSIIRKTS